MVIFFAHRRLARAVDAGRAYWPLGTPDRD